MVDSTGLFNYLYHSISNYTRWFIGIPLLDYYNPQYIAEYNPLSSSTNRGQINMVTFFGHDDLIRFNEILGSPPVQK